MVLNSASGFRELLIPCRHRSGSSFSSPAFADHDMLLDDVWSFGQDVPEEIWWPNEDRLREVFFSSAAMLSLILSSQSR